LIEQKAEGKEVHIGAPRREPARVIDLMAALQASLDKSGGKNLARAHDEDEEEEATPRKKTTAKKKTAAKPAAKTKRRKAA
jgi:non-homologous end joining protein Ku